MQLMLYLQLLHQSQVIEAIKPMKQVRFDTPRRSDPRLRTPTDMCEVLDCQEPRPPAGPRARPTTLSSRNPYELPVPYSSDPLKRYEFSDSTPYATKSKTVLPAWGRGFSEACLPSSELELSRLDISGDGIGKDRKICAVALDPCKHPSREITVPNAAPNELPQALKLPEFVDLPNIFEGDSIAKSKVMENVVNNRGFFSHPDLHIFHNVEQAKTLETSNNDNEYPLKTKVDLPNVMTTYSNYNKDQWRPMEPEIKRHCNCHKCISRFNRDYIHPNLYSYSTQPIVKSNYEAQGYVPLIKDDILEPSLCCPCVQPKNCHHPVLSRDQSMKNHQCGAKPLCCKPTFESPFMNSEGKTRAIEKYEEKFRALETGKEVEKQTAVSKEKREPTVSDLFRIIKLQNEQLKLLQEQVDRLLIKSQPDRPDSTSTPFRPPVQNFVQERLAVETVDDNHHKISIGVMTSFEVVRTSAVNKERIVKNTAQIQCNRSQVSIREVISASEQRSSNFLDGIAHVDHDFVQKESLADGFIDLSSDGRRKTLECTEPEETGNNDRTVNELSLFNFQIDNAVTPQLSPDQTIYLDVKDYSDSDNDDESRVGWTYYNKVMGHVNEMLQESCVPSSAGALHRRAVAAAGAEASAAVGAMGAEGGARCTRLHVDRTDVSITTSKRVTFGQNPEPIDSPRAYPSPTASSDTSLHINRLAAKYLRKKSVETAPRTLVNVPLEMSVATRKYMEHHNLLGDGTRAPATTIPTKFLDITALKQQPKLL